MALPILDGNQSATTLSTILTGGQHIPAHTVVSLGSQAITDMRGAVSGSVVSISNFPASQTIAGTVTANLFAYDAANDQARKLQIADTGIGLIVAGSTDANDSPVIISGTVTANAGTEIGTTGNNYGIIALGVDDTGAANPLKLDGNTNLAISGTVTANGGDGTFLVGGLRGASKTAFQMDVGTGYLQTKVESMPAISGTVTIGVVSQGCFGATIQGYDTLTGASFGNCVPVKLFEDSTGLIGNVAGTVTANNPSGALTTRFGSVTTANTAQLTSAVTNTSRKYLLVQNIATSTVTIGIGFAPTTTQGIQLTAGAGLTFDAFCPTGGVWWLSSTTGSNFSILEG